MRKLVWNFLKKKLPLDFPKWSEVIANIVQIRQMFDWQDLFESVMCQVRVQIHRLSRPVDRRTHFRMRIILEPVIVTFLVLPVKTPGSFRSGSELHANLYEFRRNSTFCRAKFLRKLLSYFSFHLLWELHNIILTVSRNTCVQRKVVARMLLLTVSDDWRQYIPFVSQCWYLKGKILSSFQDWIDICL